MANFPEIAVVVTTRNRASLLSRCLDSYRHQTLDGSRFEVVVVDDGSSDHTRTVVEACAAQLPLRYVYQNHAGLASAKNHGLFCAAAPLVLFADDDDVADAALLEHHVGMHAERPDERISVLGFTEFAPDLREDPFLAYVSDVGCFLFSYPTLAHGQTLDFTYFWGGRTSCKRSFLLRHGVFNQTFQFGCEDIELGFRLATHGLEVVYSRHAVSTMIRGFTLDEFFDRLTRQGASNRVFAALHAESQEVQAWTEVAGASETWLRVRDSYAGVVQRARHLDAMARRKHDLGFALTDNERRYLHASYESACRLAKMRGIAERPDSVGAT